MWGNIPSWAFEVTTNILSSVKQQDPTTYEHCLRVGRYARMLAQFAGLNEFEQKVAEYSGIFHDVGKVAVPPSILHKSGPLDNREFKVLKHHPLVSASLISPFGDDPFFRNLIPGVRHHHERIDGNGYPDGLAGDNIPLFARLVLIVDAFDAITQNRTYRKGRSMDTVMVELQRCAGTQFDQDLVKVFMEAEFAWQRELRNTEHKDDSARILKVA